MADCYAHGAFASQVKDYSVIEWSHRSKRILTILRSCNPDVVCLQEVDHFEEDFKPFFASMNYNVVYVQRSGREDGVLIAVKQKKFEIVQEHVVQFDDLANFGGTWCSQSQRYRYRKQNVALILLIKTRTLDADEGLSRNFSFTVCTTHMHWNPAMPQVKLAQARYLLERISYVRNDNGLPPNSSILTGDFNSFPKSKVYVCMTDGIPFPTLSGRCFAGAVERSFTFVPSNDESVKFLCDRTLHRLARWLRLLGIDTAMEDRTSQERRAASNDFSPIFNKAREERRILVTTSTGLLKRAACPESFFIKTAKCRNDLQDCLTALLNRYNVELDRGKFLSICSKCGAPLEPCSFDDDRVRRKDAPGDRELFICSKCHQVYWQSSSENGSSARGQRLAEELFLRVQRSRSAKSKRIQHDCNSEILNELFKDCRCAVDMDGPNGRVKINGTKQVRRHNWLRYKSALLEANGKEPAYTNVNGDFCGTLDYIFVGGMCSVVQASVLDRTNTVPVTSGGSYPNSNWPSDHMALMAYVSLKAAPNGRTGFSRTLSAPTL